jgi:putative membrane protein insertion efficiency factor
MRRVGKLVVLRLLLGYKWGISPMFPPACRYVPSCSEYAMEAVERYGAVRGGLMALWRVLRCHPFAAGGYDPVVKVGAGYEGATTLPQGLKPALIAGEASQRLKRCATQNLSHPNLSHQNLGHQILKRQDLRQQNLNQQNLSHPSLRHPRSSPPKISCATQNPNESFDGATLTRGAI